MKLALSTLAVAATLACGLPRAASAHEPLWGESPQTFAFGILHPELRFGYENDSLLLRGSRRLGNPDLLRRTRLDGLFSLQYAPSTSLNVRIDIPFAQVLASQRINGQVRRTGATGLGNIALSAKSRFYQRFGEDWKVHQSYMAGLSLPTGAGGFNPDGSRLSPSDAPGTNKFGAMLGYAFAYERLKDTFWASAMLMSDIGGAGSRGPSLEIDGNYGYWLRRAKRPQDLGVILAGGVHLQAQGRDRIEGGNDPNSGFDLAGVQASLIATKGQAQLRAGVMVPVYQHVNGTQLRPEIQVRAGMEILL
jgi:hypothetical protein